MSKKQITKLSNDTDVLQAKHKKAKEMLSYINTHLAFIINKISGVGLFTVGVLEFISPSILQEIELERPLSYAAIGVALISGKITIEIIKNIIDRGNKK